MSAHFTLGTSVVVAVAALIGAAALPAGSATDPNRYDESAVKAVVRGTAYGWKTIDDAGHTPIGVHSVIEMSDRVRVVFTTPCTRIAGAGATPDETYVVNGIATGASVALGHMDILFAKNGARISPNAAQIVGSNVWVDVSCWQEASQ